MNNLRQTNLPPVTTLAIFARNRLKDGWTNQQIIDALNKRLRLDSVDVDSLSMDQSERYWGAVKFMGELEKHRNTE